MRISGTCSWCNRFFVFTAVWFCLAGLPNPSILSYAADSPAITYDLPSNGYFQVLYNSASGLSSSEANDIVQTPDGFIWIGSYTGLTKYDGTTFERYTAENGVCSIHAIYVDSRHRVWLNTIDNGIARVEGDRLVFLNKKNGLSSNTTQAICELPGGIMAVATSVGIDLLYPDGSLTQFADPQIAGRNVLLLQATAEGGMAGVTMDGVFFLIRADMSVRLVSRTELHDALITAFLEEKPGVFLLGSSKGDVLRFTLDRQGEVTASLLAATAMSGISKLQRTEDGMLWLCSDSGIGFIDRDKNFHRVSGSLLSGPVGSMLVDYEQNLWFTSSRQGVLKVTPNRFLSVNAAARLPQFVANAVTFWQDDLYIATDRGLLAVNRSFDTVSTPLTRELADVRVRQVLTPPEGGLLVSTFSPHGLVRWHPDGTLSRLTEKDGLPSGMVRLTLPLANGDLAVGTRKGLALVRNNAVIRVYDDMEGLNSAQILCLLEEDGQLYVGTDGAGLFVLRDGAVVARYTQEQGLDSGVILRIRKDPGDGGLWVLTGNTVAYIKDGQPRVIRKIPTINNTDVQFTPSGGMWLFANAGIYVTTSENLRGDEPFQYLFYGAKDGLYGNMVANTFSTMDQNGILYLCTSAGVTRVDTVNHSMRNQPIRLAVPQVVVDDVPYPVRNGTVTIPGHSQRLTIQAHALTNRLTNPLLSARLEGIETQPVIRRKPDMPLLTYTNLSAGRYVFRYALLNDLTRERLQEVSVVINKEPTLMEHPLTWLALGLTTLLLTVVAFRLYVYVRTRALLEKSRETRRMLSQVIKAFARTIDFKDPLTRGHSARVAGYAAAIARKMGLSEDECTKIHDMGMLHDVGKIVIPDLILTKPSSLTAAEYAVIRTHAEAGSEILSEITSFPEMAMGAKYHHEHMDGSGYPQGVQGEAIPLAARIIAVADTFDAMLATRHYRKGAPLEQVREELARCAGNQLDADIVEVMLELMEEQQDPQEPDSPESPKKPETDTTNISL